MPFNLKIFLLILAALLPGDLSYLAVSPLLEFAVGMLSWALLYLAIDIAYREGQRSARGLS